MQLSNYTFHRPSFTFKHKEEEMKEENKDVINLKSGRPITMKLSALNKLKNKLNTTSKEASKVSLLDMEVNLDENESSETE
jgi:hypothetical protein